AATSSRPGSGLLLRLRKLLCQRVADVNLHSKQRRTVGLTLSIRLERKRAAPIKAFMKQEIQGVQIGNSKPLDFAETDPLEVFFNALCGHLLYKNRIVLRLIGDKTNVCSITLVTRACVRNF